MSVAYNTHQQIFIPTAEEALQQQQYDDQMKREAALEDATATTSSSPAQLKRKRASYLRNTAPRPPNAFMLFRKDFMDDLVMDRATFCDQLQSIDPDDKAQKSSFWAKTAGSLWKQASRDVREKYTSKAMHAKKEHAKKYPDYQYAPQRRKGTGKVSASAPNVRASPYRRSAERESSSDEEMVVEQNGEEFPLYLSSGREEDVQSYQIPQSLTLHSNSRASLSFSNPPPPPDFNFSLSPTTTSYPFNLSPRDPNAKFPTSSGAPLTPMELKFPPLPNYYNLDASGAFTFEFGSFLRRPSSSFDTSFNFGTNPYQSELDSDALLTEFLHLDHVDNSLVPSFDSSSYSPSSSSAGSPPSESYSSPSSSF